MCRAPTRKSRKQCTLPKGYTRKGKMGSMQCGHVRLWGRARIGKRSMRMRSDRGRKRDDMPRCRVEEAVGSKWAWARCIRNGIRQAVGMVRGPVGGHAQRTKEDETSRQQHFGYLLWPAKKTSARTGSGRLDGDGGSMTIGESSGSGGARCSDGVVGRAQNGETRTTMEMSPWPRMWLESGVGSIADPVDQRRRNPLSSLPFLGTFRWCAVWFPLYHFLSLD